MIVLVGIVLVAFQVESPGQVPPRKEAAGGDEPLLTALQRRRPEAMVIPPASASNPLAQRPKSKRFPEGTTAVDRPVRVRMEGDKWWCHWVEPADGPPVRWLPNVTLEQVLRAGRTGGEADVFVVTGEFTEFEGENYFLAATAHRVPGEGKVTTPATGVTTEETAGPGQIIGTDAAVDDVIKVMESQAPLRRMPIDEPALSDPNTKVGADAFTTGQAKAPLLDGTPITSRPGRLQRTREGWCFVSESGLEDRLEVPLALLPNQSLEWLIRTAERDPFGTVFVVSGETTSFEGRNYLLVRSAVRRFNMGNLSK